MQGLFCANCIPSVSNCLDRKFLLKVPVLLAFYIEIGLLTMNLICIFSVDPIQWRKTICAIMVVVVAGILIFLLANLWLNRKIGLKPETLFWIAGMFNVVSVTIIVSQSQDEYVWAIPFALTSYGFLFPIGVLYNFCLKENAKPVSTPDDNEGAIEMQLMGEERISKLDESSSADVSTPL